MDEREHKRHLIEIKDAAQAVIRKEQFRGLVQDFLRRYNHWQKKLAEYQEAAKHNPALRIKKGEEPGEPPQPGWEVETRDDYLLEPVDKTNPDRIFTRQFWRPPLPPNPVELLMPTQRWLRTFQQDDNLTPDRHPDDMKDEKEWLSAHAFLIAVVCYKLSGVISRIKLPEDPTDAVWRYYGELNNIQEYYRGDKTRSKLRDALAEVKDACSEDLEQQPSGGKNRQPKTKGWKPPKGYIGSKEIVNNRSVPRTTLQGWQERDKLKVKKDSQTRENYYPQKWFEKHFRNYKPRSRET
jgi:hypothetical protein